MSGADFWSRRKARVEAEAQTEEVRLEAEAVAEREAEFAEKSDDEILQEFGLPDPETMADGDDFQAFLAEGIPARLKTRALRRLWRVNPILANVDGLVDYGEDFTDAATVIENLQTAYQVGKGMTKHVVEMARQAAEEAEKAEKAAEEAALGISQDKDTEDGVTPADADDAAEASPGSVQPIPYEPPVFEDEGTAETNVASSRRMRFHFDDQASAT